MQCPRFEGKLIYTMDGMMYGVIYEHMSIESKGYTDQEGFVRACVLG